MISEGRDIMAVMFLEKRLCQLREAAMVRILNGSATEATDWESAESSAIQDMKHRFFSKDITRPPDESESGEPDPDALFSKRSQILSEEAVLATHRRLVEIPFVGQPEYTDQG